MRQFLQHNDTFLTYEKAVVYTSTISDMEIQQLSHLLGTENQELHKNFYKTINHFMPTNFAHKMKDYKLPDSHCNFGLLNHTFTHIIVHDIKDITDGTMYNKIGAKTFEGIENIKKIILLGQQISQLLIKNNTEKMKKNELLVLEPSILVKKFTDFIKELEKNFLTPKYAKAFEVNFKNYKSDYIKIDKEFIKNINSGFFALVRSDKEEGFVGFNTERDMNNSSIYSIVRDIKNAKLFFSEKEVHNIGYKDFASIHLNMSVSHINSKGLDFVQDIAVTIEKENLEKQIRGEQIINKKNQLKI